MNLTSPESLLFWNTLIFLILLYILAKYAWKPILSAVKTREENINKALESAEEAKKQIQNLKADNERLLAEARAERDVMLKEAKEIKDKMIAEAKGEAQAEGAKLIAQARQAIESEKKVALAQLKDEVASLSIDIAQRVMQNELSDTKKQTSLINEYLKSATLN
ncbi:ATP synthase F0 subcomplex B subunit [Capnocytophaga haemolytica]|jgi:ATP synthase F0, B subunit|uniref:ATP synthase subunit b n=1 Tax=Capnocytophaga haemolytica TaxID=45243 RepID=A0AAX2GZK1_9FLAO|nr:F0F1 ATP synthase subunit B [Capnocytophaga haemolytica]AMD84693.1 ATP F0F1 synthase subunit B [Capnocytophaga haemolytica]SFO20814.1 ATP synthase F0 subcomplex B subunit [Capnocytophaga haemolytica]SNV08360.1 F-type ATPase subunit b [Capnocytophaga haemolytica]